MACSSAGRPAVFSDAVIQFYMSIKALFKLPLKQTKGMVASLLKMADLDRTVPDYTTLVVGRRHWPSKDPLCQHARMAIVIDTAACEP